MLLFGIFRTLDFLVLGIKDWEFQHSFICVLPYLYKYPGMFFPRLHFLQYLEHSTMVVKMVESANNSPPKMRTKDPTKRALLVHPAGPSFMATKE